MSNPLCGKNSSCLSGKIFELKMGLCKALARSYLSGNDAAKAAAIAVFSQKANAQKRTKD
ncbi:hypothetical protein NYG90_01655 [Helicobacter sp. XJK30-2]|uniref:Uncharacterized protein n=1 Tax=Helicobacter zhangjianzhongii TaxID=2974574 RepID=A0ACC6FR67_9HELI|nr:hypothetical protein [Helicobacter sp. XJK30-2]MDL0081397.1 hypothetical protein [Helicobacter sp. XJK30-2]